MAYDVHRCPPPSLSQRADWQTQQNSQRNSALPLLEHPLYQGKFPARLWQSGGLLEVKQTIIDRRLNASGVRDTARSLHICTNTVLRELKKKAPMLESVHPSLLHTLHPTEVTWDLERAGEAEMDERWSLVGNKGNLRWLWHAIAHHPGEILAYGFGRRQGFEILP
jgi:InsA C-terminal domain/IS1 transposase